MMMNISKLQTLCQIAEAAGREIMAVYRDGGAVWQKDDASPLTEADLRADRVIRDGLEEHFPGVFALSEESVSEGKRDATTYFLVDPLDGTKEFLKRNGEFTVNIALIERGCPVAGVVFAPALDELFYAAQGLGAWKRDAKGLSISLQTAKFDGARALRVIGSRSHGAEELTSWLERLDYQYEFIAAGSSLKFCRLAEGLADVYPRFGLTSQWDTAAAQCVLEAAGGVVTNLSGNVIQYGLDLPTLNPHFLATSGTAVQVRLLSAQG